MSQALQLNLAIDWRTLISDKAGLIMSTCLPPAEQERWAAKTNPQPVITHMQTLSSPEFLWWPGHERHRSDMEQTVTFIGEPPLTQEPAYTVCHHKMTRALSRKGSAGRAVPPEQR